MQTLLCVDASFHLDLASASFFSLHVTRLTEPLLIFDTRKNFLFVLIPKKWNNFINLSTVDSIEASSEPSDHYASINAQ